MPKVPSMACKHSPLRPKMDWFGFFCGWGGLGQIAKLSLAKPQVNPNWTELAIVSFDPAGQPNHPPYPPTHLWYFISANTGARQLLSNTFLTTCYIKQKFRITTPFQPFTLFQLLPSSAKPKLKLQFWLRFALISISPTYTTPPWKYRNLKYRCKKLYRNKWQRTIDGRRPKWRTT